MNDSSRRPLVLAAASLAALVLVGYRLQEAQQRLERLEERPVASPVEIAQLAQQIGSLRERIEDARSEIEAAREAGEHQGLTLTQRLSALQGELERADGELARQEQRLKDFDSFREEAGPSAMDARLARFAEDLQQRWGRVGETAQEAIDIAQAASSNLDVVRQRLARDPERMWRDLLGPTVQLAGESTVGSGVLVRAGEAPVGEHGTLLLTAWHVVRDIQEGRGESYPVPLTIYAPDGSVRHETATLLRHHAGLDVALLEVDVAAGSDLAPELGARLASPLRMQAARIFEQVYAVGCPLGNDPIPTFGEIADTDHVVDGESYWMISAPTYIGNSGGGIFDAQTHELLGIFSKIYTHGALRPTVVPHMGLATPMDAIYSWLGEVGYASLVPSVPNVPSLPETHAAVAAASAER